VQHPEKAKPDAPPPPPHAGGTTTMHPDRKRDEPTVAAKAEPGAVPSVTPRAARTITSQEGAGQPLSPGDRSFFESRLGHDLGSVRIHDDSSARAAARDVQAQAFTYGQDVYFAAGRYQPGTASGRELLAHELAHTIQQRPGAPIARRIQRVPVGNPAIGTVDGDLLTLPSVQVPSFKLGRYGQQLYTGNLDARPLQRNKGYFPNTRPDQRSDWKRVGTIDTTRSEAALTAAATLPHPAPPFNAGSQYSWRLPHGEVINATVPNAARRFTLPDWNRAGEAMDFDVDHLRELQLANWPGAGSAWANTKENWALLESRANSTSGSRLRTYISHATQAFMTNPAADALTARQAISGLNASPSASQVNAEDHQRSAERQGRGVPARGRRPAAALQRQRRSRGSGKRGGRLARSALDPLGPLPGRGGDCRRPRRADRLPPGRSPAGAACGRHDRGEATRHRHARRLRRSGQAPAAADERPDRGAQPDHDRRARVRPARDAGARPRPDDDPGDPRRRHPPRDRRQRHHDLEALQCQ
jgi:hypothetical protein